MARGKYYLERHDVLACRRPARHMLLDTYESLHAGHLAGAEKSAPAPAQAELYQGYFKLELAYKLQFVNVRGKSVIMVTEMRQFICWCVLKINLEELSLGGGGCIFSPLPLMTRADAFVRT